MLKLFGYPSLKKLLTYQQLSTKEKRNKKENLLTPLNEHCINKHTRVYGSSVKTITTNHSINNQKIHLHINSDTLRTTGID